MLDPVQQQEDGKRNYIETSETVDQKPAVLPFCDCHRCSTMESERTKSAKFDGYKKIDMNKAVALTDHQYLICTCSTFAFILGIREWRRLFLDGFAMLQDLCRMFVEQKTPIGEDSNNAQQSHHAPVKPWTADYVESKGKGLVFLLHGKPGVGKTYTAECIAHQVRRPLLLVTCADIGVEPTEVEKNLRQWFKIARRWDAVMLLDEADIYMEYRQIHDLTRNNLVAGFLRAIGYYDGVLFLTANRIGTFNEAFLSRVMAIYYDDLHDDDRKKIWGTYFDKLEQERGNEIYVPRSTKEYATDLKDIRDLLWNGREIRNAEGIKDSKGQITVKEKYIQVTVDLSKDFKRYMVSLHHQTDSERARRAVIRHDAFNAP
ncbi:P-loop containing nucleoside triphosphate hydrolase protein [Ophiobolus disseminans]|uniref:P-loop containing nucleoside triphosphate hydrolase protein n=1 Tax=Ophiobolus disseminans TaxID=1469910 RepID=A0A6A7A346_9PLEO|nr:P-loop containing nucleoside triphosphate hydrolase protein [Ophiobolus disseminans]